MPEIFELKEIEECILQAAAESDRPLTLKQLAKLAGYSCTRWFRDAADRLIFHGKLIRTSKGISHAGEASSAAAPMPCASGSALTARQQRRLPRGAASIAELLEQLQAALGLPLPVRIEVAGIEISIRSTAEPTPAGDPYEAVAPVVRFPKSAVGGDP